MNNKTLDTYNNSAKELAEYFRDIGSRIDDINLALSLADKLDGSTDVLELGCGDGRDAAEIIKRSKSYLGVDYSESLIAIARETVPTAKFEVENMTEFAYPKDKHDVVFAFASILHIDKKALADLLPRIANSLKRGGVFYISSKFSPEYKEEWKEDKFGKRLFYFYNPEILGDLSEEVLEAVHTSRSINGGTEWFEMALRKK